MQLAAMLGEYVPVGQLWQEACNEAPMLPEYNPARHMEHTVEPVFLWKVPVEHDEHTLALAVEYFPDEQLRQSDDAALPVVGR
jgi:hypothetical protein